MFDKAFQKLLDKSNRKPNKIWVDKDSEFYNRSINLFLTNNDIEMYSTYNEGKFAISKRFIRIYYYMGVNIYRFSFCSGTFLASRYHFSAPRGLKKSIISTRFCSLFSRYLEYLRSQWIHRWFTTSKSTCAACGYTYGSPS